MPWIQGKLSMTSVNEDEEEDDDVTSSADSKKNSDMAESSTGQTDEEAE